MVKDIAFTGYTVTDMARARDFYERRLGLQMETHWEDKWVEYAVGGGTFAIQNVMGGPPTGQRGIVAFEVDDFDQTLAGLKAAGVPVEMDAYESPVCWMAIVNDPDGNPVCIHHRKSPTPPAVAP
ncbi:MAG: VOC family protein [Gluconacetobacter diazotrophicus]|nr:VOC family protein [Gluconacetobacter diazotrophicus]